MTYFFTCNIGIGEVFKVEDELVGIFDIDLFATRAPEILHLVYVAESI